MMTIDAGALTNEIATTVRGIVKTDLKLLQGYSTAKARAIAGYTLLIGDGYARGDLTEDHMKREMAELDRMVVRFVRNLQALAATTAERLITGLRALAFGVLARMAGLNGLFVPSAAFV